MSMPLARSGKMLSTGLSKVAPHALDIHNLALYHPNEPDDLLIQCCGGAATASLNIL
jgi:hypothetical protein